MVNKSPNLVLNKFSFKPDQGVIKELKGFVYHCYNNVFPSFSRFPEGYKVPELYRKVREACRKNLPQRFIQIQENRFEREPLTAI